MKFALDYIREGQMSIFDYTEPKEKAKPKFKIGQRVYKIVLDVVETGKIAKMWDVDEKYYGYRTDEDNIVFWDEDLNNRVFTDKTRAYTKANSLKDKLVVMRKEDMKVVKERNFIETCNDSRILISATVKLLENNMVYWNDFYTYHFLEKFETEKDAEKRYDIELNKILNNPNVLRRFEVNVPAELKDMYLCKHGTWSEHRYAYHNGVLEVQE